jgi:enamine deaminase RidA (YjgF/YER057c/UK114 family)
MRKRVSSASPFEPRLGFSRAVRVGEIVAVLGTAPIAADGSVASPGDVYGQTKRCLEVIADALVDAGLSLDTVVRTRIMLTDVSQWEAAVRAHGESFGAIRLQSFPSMAMTCSRRNARRYFLGCSVGGRMPFKRRYMAAAL